MSEATAQKAENPLRERLINLAKIWPGHEGVSWETTTTDNILSLIEDAARASVEAEKPKPDSQVRAGDEPVIVRPDYDTKPSYTELEAQLHNCLLALRQAGICVQCLKVADHDIMEPFSHCGCGTSEDYTPGLISRLQWRDLADGVSRMNTKFGNLKGAAAGKLTEVDGRLHKQLKMLRDELERELDKAFADGDEAAIVDVMGDVVVFVFGAFHLADIEPACVVREILRAQWSKFCVDQDMLEATVRKYANIGVEVSTHGEFPFAFVRATADVKASTGEMFIKGKFLKGTGYQDANLTPLLGVKFGEHQSPLLRQ